MEISQFVPGFLDGDAISNYTVEMQNIIRDWGYTSNIYGVGRHVHSLVQDRCLDYLDYQQQPEDIAIYHFSVGSELSGFFRNLKSKKVLIYHNITPAKYFHAISSEKAMVLDEGRRQLFELSNVPDLSLAVSAYNAQELLEAGFKDPKVFPLLFNTSAFNINPSRKILRKFRKKGTNILFVGRIAPNKKCEDVIQTFYYYKKTIDPLARLFLVGSFSGMDRYLACLRALTVELDLADIYFTGHVTQTELVSYYRIADVFLCMSEHEGFCIPLLEAMHFQVPVVAYAAAGVPGTLDGNGVLVHQKNYPYIAELIQCVNEDASLKANIVQKQLKRLNDFSAPRLSGQFKELLTPLMQ
ncbi:MAG: glycosyltransferase family 4 protein [Chlamydiota bacterium]|nr:glycosyltransferase family 4 protein [Chlamydiota bacterium]